MDELISRQEVIKKLDEALESITKDVSKESDVYHIIYGTIGIIKCMIMTIHPEPHWIPVTEEPKEEEKSYWVCLEGGGQCQCRWTNDVYGIGANPWSKWGWKKVDLPQFSKVVAYMPLPEPYKGVTT